MRSQAVSSVCSVWFEIIKTLLWVWNMHLQNSYVEIITPSVSERALLWKYGHCRCATLRRGHSGFEWRANPLGLVSSERGGIWTQIHMGRRSHEDQGRKGEKPWNAKEFQSTPEARKEAWNRFFLRASRRNQLCSSSSLMSSIPNCETTNLCFLNYPGLLW